jgi:hypothetical protein
MTELKATNITDGVMFLLKVSSWDCQEQYESGNFTTFLTRNVKTVSTTNANTVLNNIV